MARTRFFRSRVWFIIWSGALVAGALGCEGPKNEIELTNICSADQIQPHCVQWVARSGFDPAWFAKANDDPLWQAVDTQKPTGFKIWINQLFPEESDRSYGEWTFVTWFDAP
ncbi:MAG: hypothetical protein KDK39_00870, partial [Leptospiraceae bacterium]|nr:hypothetical protein [Leptospiraceae bacterium]